MSVGSDGLRRFPVILTAAAVVALSGWFACREPGDPILQAHHPNGTVLRVSGIQTTADHVSVDVVVTNGSHRTIRLSDGGDLVLVDDLGNRHRLVSPAADPHITLRPGATLEGRFVFMGALHPEVRSVSLITNERRGSETWDETPAPKLCLEIPVRGNFGSASDGQVEPPGGSPEPLASRFVVRDLNVTEFEVREVAGGLEIQLLSDVLFAFDRHDLRPEGREVLARVAMLLAERPGTMVEVRGHTDSLGTPEYNQRLSELRAKTVRDQLVHMGIAPDRIESSGLGALRPVAPNALPDGSDNPEGRQLNRRVEILVRETEFERGTDSVDEVQPSPGQQ